LTSSLIIWWSCPILKSLRQSTSFTIFKRNICYWIYVTNYYLITTTLRIFFLAWYYIPEPGLVIELREEMFNDTRFGSEVFYAHVRGVDTIFILSYIHILKKNLFKKLCKHWSWWLINWRVCLFLISYNCFLWNLFKCNTFKWFNINDWCKYFLIII